MKIEFLAMLVFCLFSSGNTTVHPSINKNQESPATFQLLHSSQPKQDTAIDTKLSYSRAKNVVRCVFNTASEGDCPHIKFSCGDFGLAEIRLNAQEQALWSSLYSDGPTGYVPNDDLVGKVFQITYQKTSVKACDGSEDLHQVDAPRVIGFKLISNP